MQFGGTPLDLKMFGVAPVAPILKRWRGNFTLAHFSPKIAKKREVLKFDREFGLATKTGVSVLNFRELRDTGLTRQPAEIGRPLLDKLD